MTGFIFGKGTPWTYEQLQRQRQIADSIASRIGSPRNDGEGLTAIGNALAARGINKRADARDAELKGQFDGKWSGIAAALGGKPQGSGIAFSAPPDPNSPQVIGGATMAALGKAPDYGALEQKYGLPSGYLSRTAQIESGGNPNAQNPNSSAGGTFQFIDSTAKQYGLTNKNDPVASADAAARLAADNRAVLIQALGREPSAGELYLAHQQGAGGAVKLISNQNAPAATLVGDDAANLNGGAGMTGGQLANQWIDKFGGQSQPQYDMAALAEVAGSPYASAGQKAIVGALIQRQLEASQPPDPMKALELQKAQYEVAHLGDQKPPSLQTFNGPDGTVYSFDPTSGTTSPLTGAKDPNADGGTEYGLTPQYGVDAQGNPVLIQVGKNGTTTSPKLPDGVSLSKSPIKIDAGTEWILLDPITRQPVGRIPKELAAAATEKAVGKATGEAMAAKNSLSSKMAGIETVVKRLDDLSNKATYTTAGRVLDYGIKEAGMQPRESAVARSEYIATVNNQILPLLRDTFGAQFTEREGATLRETLGDPNKTPAEKQVVLKAFIEQKKRDLKALEAQAGGSGQGAAGSDSEYLKSLGLE